MRTRSVCLCCLVLAAAASAVGVAPADAAEPAGTTLVVDRDRAQCANADFTSIQAAVDAAQPEDVVRVCPDRYGESVVIDKPLTLKGDPEAVEAVDCIEPMPTQLGDLDPTEHAVVDPTGEGFSIALKLNADDVVVEGLAVEGASVGIDAGDRFSGYRIDHNLIRHNALFGIDFGSEGTRASRVDHNCLRENSFGLVSELDDDSLWKLTDGPERDAWNARDLINARIDHNATFGNAAGSDGGALYVFGPGRRDRLTVDHNVSRDDLVAIALQNSIDSAILENDVVTRLNSIVVGGGNERLVIRANRVHDGGRTGIAFAGTGGRDQFPLPSRNVEVRENDVRFVGQAGISAAVNNLADSEISQNVVIGSITGAGITFAAGSTGNVISDNTSSANHATGLFLGPNSSGNRVSGNTVNDNGRHGIYAACDQRGCATNNAFERNSMHGNGTDPAFSGVDARDDAWPLNRWINNDCDTDLPTGMICVVG